MTFWTNIIKKLNFFTSLFQKNNQPKQVKLLVGASVYLSASIIQNVAQYFLLPIWATFLTPEDFGIIGAATIYTSVFSSIMIFGLNASVLRQSQDYQNDILEYRSYITSVVTLQFGWGIILTIFLFLVGPFAWNLIEKEIQFYPFVALVVWTLFMRTWNVVPQAITRAQQKAKLYAVFTLSEFFLDSLITAIFVIGFRMGALGKLLGSAVASTLMAIVYSIWFFSKWFSTKISKGKMVKAFKYGIPLLPHNLAAYLNRTAGRMILNPYVNLAAFGLFSLGNSIGNIMTVLVDSINQAWIPYYFDLMKHTQDADEKVIQIFSIYLASLGIITLTGILFASEIVDILFNQTYHGIIIYIPPILLGGYILGWYKFLSSPIFYFGQTKLVPMITVVSLVVNIVVNLIFVPIYGPIATAWSLLLANIVMVIIAYYLGDKIHHVDYPYGKYLILTGSLLVATILVSFSDKVVFNLLVWKILFWTFFCMFSYWFFIRKELRSIFTPQ